MEIEKKVSSARVSPTAPTTRRALRVQGRIQGGLGVVGLAAAGAFLYPKLLVIATGDLGAIGVGLVANLALVFGSLMFVRNALLLRARAAALPRPETPS